MLRGSVREIDATAAHSSADRPCILEDGTRCIDAGSVDPTGVGAPGPDTGGAGGRTRPGVAGTATSICCEVRGTGTGTEADGGGDGTSGDPCA